jgi:hypothetical protein
MCLTLDLQGDGRGDVLYSGLRVWTKMDEWDKCERFFRAVYDNGRMAQFEARARDVFSRVDPATLAYMREQRFGFDFYARMGNMMTRNCDVFDSRSIIIARLLPEEVELFFRVHRRSIRWKLDAVAEIALDRRFDSARKYRPAATDAIFGEAPPPSGRGLCPDFRDPAMIRHVYQQNEQFARIKVKMTGSRSGDYIRAFKAAGIDPSDPALADYTWHHLDDIAFDEYGNATCTMQLVRSYMHKDQYLNTPVERIVAGWHVGSVKLWEMLYLVPYK